MQSCIIFLVKVYFKLVDDVKLVNGKFKIQFAKEKNCTSLNFLIMW